MGSVSNLNLGFYSDGSLAARISPVNFPALSSDLCTLSARKAMVFLPLSSVATVAGEVGGTLRLASNTVMTLNPFQLHFYKSKHFLISVYF